MSSRSSEETPDALSWVEGNVKTYAAMLRATCVGILTAVAVACGGSVRDSGTIAHVEYSVSAQQNYERGMKKVQDEAWIEAIRYFQFVKSRFPYSKFAVLADLRMADAALGAESYLEAIDQYKVFSKFHPTHEMVENGYAAYKIGDAYFHMLPDEWFLAPPAFEKDQTAAHDAARELQNVVKNYPNSPYAKKAKDLYEKTAHLLAAHEFYVAEFYWKREQPMGTVLRLRNLLKNYPGVGYDESALYLLGRAYVKIGKKDDAKKSLQTFIERFPKSDKANDAKQMMSGLGG
jgi:outer membrane protein assembly factor BamD